MTNNLVIVFTRNPELGKVKTRLAKTIGDTSALIVYKYLLEHTQTTIQNLNCEKAVFYSEEVIQNDIWDNNIYTKFLQVGNNLGERMLNAYKLCFDNNYTKIIIVGSDLLDLKPIHINNAFKQMDNHDIVIGPAQDLSLIHISEPTRLESKSRFPECA